MHLFKQYLLAWLRRKRFYYASVAAFGALFFVYDTSTMRWGDQLFTSHLKNAFGYELMSHHLDIQGRPMRYVELGSDDLPLIVFIHGAPASSAFWKPLLTDSTLLANAKLLAVDRPGYGFSDYGNPEISVAKQAELIAQILREKRKTHRRIIVHGSSYGGTVAARLAMDYPELVDGLLLQSASLKPGAETTYWISYPTSHWSLSWLVPGSLHVANAEKLSHPAQLTAMAAHWSNIRSHCIVLQGDADRLIFPENAQYAYQRLTGAASVELRLIPGRKHDLLVTRTALLRDSLLKLLDRTAG